MNEPTIDGPHYLFVGGTRDGARLPVDPRQTLIELPLPGQKPRRKGAPFPTEIYQRMRFNGETESYDVFALRGISGNSIMKALIENYPQRE